MPIPTTDDLRTLNLAYRKMQEDFEVFAEELFRTNTTLTSDASGYIYIPNDLTQLELIVTTSNLDEKWEKIDKHLMNSSTGYYWDGVDTVTTFKRRIMIRENGTAKTSLGVTIQYLKEYADLSATTSVPYPFVGKRFLNLLTTLQAFYWFDEQGDDRATEAQRQLSIYNKLLATCRSNYFDDSPTYGQTHSNDAGDARRTPLLNPSAS